MPPPSPCCLLAELVFDTSAEIKGAPRERTLLAQRACFDADRLQLACNRLFRQVEGSGMAGIPREKYNFWGPYV